MQDFELRLENLRDEHGYTKKEVSLKLGFTENVYGAYERGERSPSLETLIKLADLYNVSLDYILRGKEFFKKDSENQYNRFLKIISHFECLGFDHPYILEVNKWILLDKEDIKELTNHFEWVVAKSKKKR